ncbi:SPOR domain-containing protein [Bacillus sp. CLL-7-23]|uniref:SPOR domain-containing protein n=1 Tax=Bacillus changyiensis TaxID=3004103 RepID=A0ABT4X778_9BACI|nr:SPOR domain-containing protein [Bacillus changyiensis]MDA7027599.1 SPOR domain-containing protein [Bacillus changyiensis]
MKKRRSKVISSENEPLRVMINGREEIIYGTEEELSKSNEEKKLIFSNWEEKRKAEQELSASQEDKTPETDEFTWVSPDEDLKDDPKVVTPFKKKMHDKGNKKAQGLFVYFMKRFATTIVFAILLGTGLGVFALNLSTTKEAVPATSSFDTDESKPVKAGDSSENSSATKENHNFKTFVVQVGKFSAKEGAESLVSQIINKGYAAISLTRDDGHYVIGGLSGEKQITLQLEQILKETDFDAWGGKELSFPLDSNVNQAFEKAAELSSKAILGAEVSAENIAELKAETDKVQSSGDNQSLINSLHKVENLLKKPTAENGWKSQQLLLNQLK